MPRGIPGSGAAKDNPVLKTDTIEVEGQAGQDTPRIMSTVGPAALSEAVVEPVPNMIGIKEHAEALAFNEELIEVVVSPSTDRYAENPVYSAVNGRNQFFFRGQPQVVKRKFVEALARARTTAYTQDEFIDAKGNRAVRNIPSTSLAYPFQVLRDENPRGRDWLRQILAQ